MEQTLSLYKPRIRKNNSKAHTQIYTKEILNKPRNRTESKFVQTQNSETNLTNRINSNKFEQTQKSNRVKVHTNPEFGNKFNKPNKFQQI